MHVMAQPLRITCAGLVLAMTTALGAWAGPAVAYPLSRAAIAGIHVGMTPTNVRAVLGKPRKVVKERDEDDGDVIGHIWVYPDRLEVSMHLTNLHCECKRKKKREKYVEGVRTHSPKDRLWNGLHVGNTEKQLHQALKHLICFDYSGNSPRNTRSRKCDYYFKPAPGVAGPCEPPVDFDMRHKRVRFIDVSVPASECEPDD